MQRRGITVAIGAVVVMLLGISVTNVPVPYVLLEPGPTQDTLGEDPDGEDVITVTGADESESAGQLHLTTVSVVSEVDLVTALRGWFDDERAVVPEELFYPPDESREEVEQRNVQQFTRSQAAAESAAMRYLGYDSQVVVTGVLEGGPAAGELAEGDVVTAVDGSEVDEIGQLQSAVTSRPAGSTLTIEFLRDGEPGTVEVTTAENEEGTPRVGIEIAEQFDTGFELDIDLEGIGGPSAGLMFSLGIVDTLEQEDLTGGQTVAGTGTIDPYGRVGAIGGIAQKLVAARELDARVFLVPAGNCDEAVAHPQPGLTLARVETLDDAVTALEDVRADREPLTC